MKPKITPFLWFNDEAEEAANFYVSIFKNSEILSVNYYGDAVPGMAGNVLTTSFRLDGQEFIALNGGPGHPFTDAISFSIDCASQAEVDELWATLTEDGEPGPCGWLTDKFGLSWQVVPARLTELLRDPDPERAGRVTRAMLQMQKIDIAELERAYAGE